MIGKKINQLATELAPVSTDLTIIGDPTTGVSKKITLAQLGAIFSGAVSFYTNLAGFPAVGDINVIYCAKDTQKLYLWSGSAYVEVFPSQALLDTYQLRSEKGNANGYASLDSQGKVPISQLPSSIMEYKGTWNASTNTPTLANGTGDTGDVYICNVAGTVNFGAGPITFAVGDYVIYSGTIWQRSSGAVGTVTSVAITESGDALTITGSPITTSGTINIGFAGTGAQYIKGDGTLATFPSIISQAQNLITEVYNSTGATLTKGTVVYINGGQGNLPTVTKALASGDSTSAQTYGIVQADITNMNNGYVVVAGRLSDLDTQAYTEGTQLYLSSTTAGAYTSTKQYAPAHLVYVGIIVRSHPTQGIIEVKIQNGYELDELHNVAAQSPSNGDILQYVSSTSLWTKVAGTTSNIAEGSNLYYTDARSRAALSFTAGSGAYNSTTGVITIPTNTNQLTNGASFITLASLSAGAGISYNNTTGVIASTITQYTDANARAAISLTTSGTSGAATYNSTTGVLNVPQYAPDLSGYVPTSRTLTINGTAYDLSANRSWSVGTVTSVGLSSATSGVTIGSTPITTSGTITLAIATASGSQQGLLSSTDWTTFNNKQNALTNPVTGTGTTNTLPKFTGASTIGNSNITDTGSLITLGSNTTISSGALGIGTSSLSQYGLRLSKNITGAVTSYGISSEGVIQSDAITNGWYYNSLASTAAASFTVGNIVHYFAQQGTFGAGSTVTRQYGIFIASNLIGATNNFGLYSDIPSGTNRWNLYMNGTANNYMAGSLGIGNTSVDTTMLRISRAFTSTLATSIFLDSQVSSTNTSATYIATSANTQAATFTTQIRHISLVQGTFGAGSTVTNQYGIIVGDLTGATNNYGFFGNISAATNRWNLFMAGTAANYMAGVLNIGTTTLSGFTLDVNGTARVSGQLTANSFVPTSSTIPTNGMYLSGTNTLGFATNGTLDMVLDASGNLGLGVTPSAWGSGQRALQTPAGAIWNFNASNMSIVQNVFSDGTEKYVNNGFASTYNQNSGQHVWRTAPSGTAGNAISFTQAMTLDASGRLGIGTTAPTTNLQVYQTGGAGNNYVEGTIQVGGTSSTLGGAFSYAAQNSGYVNITNLNNGGGANARISFGFGAITSGLPANNVMTINQSGNVGIGTTAPNSLLEVNRTITFSNVDTYAQLVVKTTSGANGKLLNIGVDETNSVSFIQSLNRGTDVMPLSLQRYGGAVLIGTTTEGFLGKLQVAGSVAITGQYNTVLPSSSFSYFDGSGQVVSSSSNASALYLDTTWNTTGNPDGIYLNVTNTASGASSKLLNLKVGSVSQFSVSKAGAIQTTAPSSGSAQPWKLGSYAAGGTGTATGVIYIEINGQIYSIPALQGTP